MLFVLLISLYIVLSTRYFTGITITTCNRNSSLALRMTLYCRAFGTPNKDMNRHTKIIKHDVVAQPPLSLWERVEFLDEHPRV